MWGFYNDIQIKQYHFQAVYIFKYKLQFAVQPWPQNVVEYNLTFTSYNQWCKANVFYLTLGNYD